MKSVFWKGFLVLLAFCMVFSLPACRGKTGGEDGDFAAVKDGTAVCRIVYPSDENALNWRSAANMLARTIKKLTGTAPETVSDSEPQSGSEILIGSTNRAPSATALAGLDAGKTTWSYSVTGKYLVIAAREPEEASLAVAELEKQLEALGVKVGEGELIFPRNLAYTYVKPEIVISEDEPWALFNDVNTEKNDASFLSAEQLFKVYTQMQERFGITAYLCMQGACTDGKYGYFFMDNTVSDAQKHYNYIVKVELATGDAVQISEKVNLGHSNDACYNPDTGRIVVACNSPDSDLIKFVDPETLEVTGEKWLSVPIFAIAYNPYTAQYAVGLSGGRNLALLDADFKVVKRLNTDYSSYHKDMIYTDYDGTNAELLTQGIDCDGKYVYFVLSGHERKEGGGWSSYWTNYLVAFDYEGKHRFTKTLPGPHLEVENIFHVGKTVYFSCHGWKSDPCYRLDVKAQ